MSPSQKADLVFFHVLAPKMQEALDNIELNPNINKSLIKVAIRNLQKKLSNIISSMYKGITEEEEEQLRDLTSAIDLGLEEFKKALIKEYE